MKSYTFKVVLEKDKWPDEPNSEAVWRAYVPSLEELGAATWGKTKEEALKHIEEVLHMILQEMQEDGQELPDHADIKQSEDPHVSVTIS